MTSDQGRTDEEPLLPAQRAIGFAPLELRTVRGDGSEVTCPTDRLRKRWRPLRQGTKSCVRLGHPRRCSTMMPSDTGSTPLQPGSPRSDREAVPDQLDLFAERGAVTVRRTQNPLPSTPETSVERLTEDELLERIPNAGPSDVYAICAEIVSRSLVEAVPALEALWQRFAGFGIKKPLAKQLAVVDTFARIGCSGANSALRRMVLSRALPASLLPAALQAAAQAGLALPAEFVGSFLTHGDAAVRKAAFALTAKSNVAADRLREGLLDPSAVNRRLATIALGLRGDPSAAATL